MRITVADAAQLMGITSPTLRKLIRLGAVDLGTTYRAPNQKRTSFIITPSKFAAFLGISTDELEQRINRKEEEEKDNE